MAARRVPRFVGNSSWRRWFCISWPGDLRWSCVKNHGFTSPLKNPRGWCKVVPQFVNAFSWCDHKYYNMMLWSGGYIELLSSWDYKPTNITGGGHHLVVVNTVNWLWRLMGLMGLVTVVNMVNMVLIMKQNTIALPHWAMICHDFVCG